MRPRLQRDMVAPWNSTLEEIFSSPFEGRPGSTAKAFFEDVRETIEKPIGIVNHQASGGILTGGILILLVIGEKSGYFTSGFNSRQDEVSAFSP
jgi:hypothetical protein